MFKDPYGYVDSLGNDQFLIYQENTGYIYRNGSSGEKPTLVYSKEVCILKTILFTLYH